MKTGFLFWYPVKTATSQNGDRKTRQDIGWNSSKIISWLVNLRCSLSTDLNITDLLQGEHPKFLTQSDPLTVD